MRKTLAFGMAVVVAAVLVLAPRVARSKVDADDCTKACIDAQKSCMFTCSQVSDDADNQACSNACVKKYTACTKGCKKK